jgi:2-hydroxy-3-keto-5-methylthiopentenyl-1-phosphate phosphatase
VTGGARNVVVCDFDGTIAVEDVTNLIWDKHLPYQWREVLIPPSREGKISALEMIGLGYADVKAPPEQLLAEVLPRVRLREGWAQFVATCAARRWPLHVVSHGLDFYIRRILPPGVPLTCFEGTFEGDRWRVALPPGVTLTPGEDFKTHVVSALRAQHPDATTVYVGDGRLDFPAARTCDRLFAVEASTLARMCASAGINHQEFATFDQITEELAQPPPPGAPPP